MSDESFIRYIILFTEISRLYNHMCAFRERDIIFIILIKIDSEFQMNISPAIRNVIIAIDDSEYAEFAFDCKYVFLYFL